MAPKSKRGQEQKGRGAEEEVEEPLQAVILADSFETRFSPFTLERPRCLLPLANTPLIEYTFEFLANAGVEEVYVYCGAHTDQVEEYIQQSKWTSKVSPFSRLEIVRSTSSSIGDAMRDLDKRDIFSGDFLIVYGDVISNLPVQAALAAHRERREKDKNAIMTMVLREAGTQHRTKSHDTAPVFVIDPTKQRCLHYEQIELASRGGSRHLKLDPDIMFGHDEIEIRQDLIDCGIDICTPDVLALWSDNFDYEYPRKGFLHSVLKDYELNGKTIHTHIVDEHYAARVKNLRAYDAVSRDVLARWAYPICPDTNLMHDHTYRLVKGNVYREEGVVLARSCRVEKNSVVGRATAIGEGSVVTNSVIGRRCIIGKNVIIQGSYIWDDATVGDGTVVLDSIVANEASVGKRCKLQPGSLISYGVHISDNMTIKERGRVTRMKRKRGKGLNDEDTVIRGENDVNVVGKGGAGFEYVASEDEGEDQEAVGLGPAGLYNLASLSLSQESISTLNSQLESVSDDFRRSRTESFGSAASIASEEDGRQAVDFHHDAAASIYDSLQKGDESSNIQLELTALRMTADASPHQVRRAVIAAFMKRIAALVEDEGVSATQAVKKTLPVHKTLLSRTMFDHGDEHESKPDQVDFLLLMQADLCHRKDGDKIMLMASNDLALNDIVETEGFEQWWESEKSGEGEEMQRVRAPMEQFMDAILSGSESESESESEEEESEEESEEEEESDDE